MNKFPAMLLLALACVFFQSDLRAADEADAVLGVWHTTGNHSDVLIFKKDGHYCGRVVRIAEPNFPADDKLGMGGKPRTDRKNPDPKLRGRLLLGMEMMTGFVYASGNVWNEGRVYDPESGNTYRGKMTLKKNGELELRGYVGISLFGRTVTWKR